LPKPTGSYFYWQFNFGKSTIPIPTRNKESDNCGLNFILGAGNHNMVLVAPAPHSIRSSLIYQMFKVSIIYDLRSNNYDFVKFIKWLHLLKLKFVVMTLLYLKNTRLFSMQFKLI
jgi:hypothetical protein